MEESLILDAVNSYISNKRVQAVLKSSEEVILLTNSSSLTSLYDFLFQPNKRKQTIIKAADINESNLRKYNSISSFFIKLNV